METLSNLKRALNIGVKLQRLERFGKKEETEVVGTIVKVQTNAIVLDYGEGNKRAVWLSFPSARLLSFDGDTFSIHQSGQRPFNDDEKRVWNARPCCSDEVNERDMLSDGNTEFWLQKGYWLKNPEYRFLSGYETACGKRVVEHPFKDCPDGLIEDEAIKGNAELVYRIIV